MSTDVTQKQPLCHRCQAPILKHGVTVLASQHGWGGPPDPDLQLSFCCTNCQLEDSESGPSTSGPPYCVRCNVTISDDSTVVDGYCCSNCRSAAEAPGKT